MNNLELEEIADNIADEVVIEYTKDTILTPDEAFQLNQLIFRKALSILVARNEPALEEVTA